MSDVPEGGEVAREVVDLTELSDAEDDLVVYQVSLPKNNPSIRRSGLGDSSSFVRRVDHVANELQQQQQQQPHGSQYHSYGRQSVVVVGPPLNKMSCDFASKTPSSLAVPAHREDKRSVPVPPMAGYRVNSSYAGPSNYETQYHRAGRGFAHHNNATVAHSSPSSFRCTEPLTRLMIGPILEQTPCNERRKCPQTDIEAAIVSDELARLRQHGRAPSGVIHHPQMTRQTDWSLVDGKRVKLLSSTSYFSFLVLLLSGLTIFVVCLCRLN